MTNETLLINLANTICLAIVFIAALLHLNTMDRATAGCERFGFVFTAAGAAGHALGYWWPWGGAEGVETFLHIGLALVAISLARGDLRAMLASASVWPRWDGKDRRAGR